MSLPPDPHDDDLADPSPGRLRLPARRPTAGLRPPPALPPAGRPPPARMATAPPPHRLLAATCRRPAGPRPSPRCRPRRAAAPPGAAQGPPPSTGLPPIEPAATATTAETPGHAATRHRWPGPPGVDAAGVVAIVAVAGVVVVLTGDDGSDTPAAAEEVDGDDRRRPRRPTASRPTGGQRARGDRRPADSTSELSPWTWPRASSRAVRGRLPGDHRPHDGRVVQQPTARPPSRRSPTCEASVDDGSISHHVGMAVGDVSRLDRGRATSPWCRSTSRSTARPAPSSPLQRVDGEWKMDLDPPAVAPSDLTPGCADGRPRL